MRDGKERPRKALLLGAAPAIPLVEWRFLLVRLNDAIQRSHILLVESYQLEYRVWQTYMEAQALLERLRETGEH